METRDSQQVALEKAHQVLFEMLVILDTIFKKHNIRYFISCGTLLGAVRHKGFIPWDDDLDVHVYDEDYNAALKFLNQELDLTKYILHNNTTDPMYWITYTKFRHLGSQIVSLENDKQQDFKYKGLHLDLFRARSVKWFNVFFHQLMIVLIHSHRYNKNRHDSLSLLKSIVCSLTLPIVILIYKLLDLIPGERVRVCKNFPWLDVGNGKGHQVYKEEVLMPFCELEFMGRRFNAPHDYDSFLSVFYGDYMQLPPPEKRRIHFKDIIFT